jgi:para-aminobenzoate synthetase component 1
VAGYRTLVEELSPNPGAWSVALHLAGQPHLLFLDSALPTSRLGRYSFVAADPFAWVQARGRHVSINGVQQGESDPFEVLARLLSRYRADLEPGLPPFQGGAAGLFGYDLCHHIERLPRPRFDEFETPDLAVGLYDWMATFDHVQGRAWLIATGFPEVDPERRHQRARQRLDELRGLLSRPPSSSVARITRSIQPVVHHALHGVPPLWSNFDRRAFLNAVRRVIDYIRAGDCFQVNLAQRLLHPNTVPPLELYRRLRECNPAPFAGYFDMGEFIVASASPERFVCVHGREVETRPIKGTRPRGTTPEDDAARAAELLASEKDRAENVMIIDLLRNDLGRVCAYGSVRVDSVCRLESYQTVHHLVSEVRGQLRPGLGPIDLLRASFPGGSVTGAPKVRAMEVIAELEPTARGPYCGSLGYIGFDGTMDTNILIRTFTIGKGWIQFPVGGGIVADSTPEGEYAETLDKAEGLVRALHEQ